MKKPAVFIDRDGTVNEQMGYVNHPSRFVILSGVVEYNLPSMGTKPCFIAEDLLDGIKWIIKNTAR